jgi:type I restriction enzyme R subunit
MVLFCGFVFIGGILSDLFLHRIPSTLVFFNFFCPQKALQTAFFYEADAVGGKEQFGQVYGPQENLAVFIRSLVGLDRGKAKERFAQFLDGQTYTADQIRFVNYIIDHLTANGTLDPELLYGQPYTDIHYQGLTGVFSDIQAKELLRVVRAVNVVVG